MQVAEVGAKCLLSAPQDRQTQLIQIEAANSDTLLDVLATLSKMRILVDMVYSNNLKISVLAQVQPLHQTRLPILLQSLTSVCEVQIA